MKYHDLAPKIRSQISLLVVGTLGALLSIILMRYVPNDNTTNRFLMPLMPMVFGGTALTLFTTFMYGVISLATEPEFKNRRTMVGLIILTVIIAYLFLFNAMGSGGID